MGTFWLALGGCGGAVLAATFPDTGIGFGGHGPGPLRGCEPFDFRTPTSGGLGIPEGRAIAMQI